VDKNELMKLEKEEIIAILFAITEQQAKVIRQQANMIEQLTAEVAELKARSKQNSKNSSKPPSSDGFNKPKSLRTPSGKKAGGQAGHNGSGLELANEPDQYMQHMPKECENCPQALNCQAHGAVGETRYEIDIVVQPVTTAHQTMSLICPQTGTALESQFPSHIGSTMQYGINLKALAVSLNTTGMVSINRTHEILNGVFGVPISTGAIAHMVSECAEAVKDSVSEIREAVKDEPLAHADETGVRVDKKTAWAHVISTSELTCIDVEPSRGKKGINAVGVLPAFMGTLIHDCWASYFSYTSIRHGLCNAHLLRELTAALENTGQQWAKEMIDLLLAMKAAKEEFILHGLTAAASYYLKKFSMAYDRIMEEALAQNPLPMSSGERKRKPKRGKTGALVDRLLLRKGEYLLFFTDFSVPFDNNQAERDIRMFKVKQKVSGCFRTMKGAKDFAAIMSYIGTARKHGVPAFHAIKNAIVCKPFSVDCLAATE